MSLSRHPWGARLDRLTPWLLRLGRWLRPPSEDALHTLTGRSRGAPKTTRASAGPSFEALLQSGRLAVDEGSFAEALVQFQRAAELEPRDPWPWHGRGDAFQLSESYPEAEQAYRAAIEREPGLALSWSGLGNALEQMGRYEAAGEAWREALRHDDALRWAREGLRRLEERDT